MNENGFAGIAVLLLGSVMALVLVVLPLLVQAGVALRGLGRVS